MEKLFSMHSKEGLPNGANEIESTTTGFIVSSEGQHKYPGKKTMIPNANGRITMSKVGYPVLGIDDLGNSVMMQPGGEYQFPGNDVYEIPMAQDGLFLRAGKFRPQTSTIGSTLGFKKVFPKKETTWSLTGDVGYGKNLDTDKEGLAASINAENFGKFFGGQRRLNAVTNLEGFVEPGNFGAQFTTGPNLHWGTHPKRNLPRGTGRVDFQPFNLRIGYQTTPWDDDSGDSMFHGTTGRLNWGYGTRLKGEYALPKKGALRRSRINPVIFGDAGIDLDFLKSDYDEDAIARGSIYGSKEGFKINPSFSANVGIRVPIDGSRLRRRPKPSLVEDDVYYNPGIRVSDPDAVEAYEEPDEYQDGGTPKVKQRRGARKNPDGSVSTHLMRAEYIPERGWVAFPSLFQDSKPYADDSRNWVDMSDEEDWMKIYEEADARGEVYDFGEDKEAALAFGKGSWKDQLPDEGIEIELSDEEIQEYIDGGYVLEELQDGGTENDEISCPPGYIFDDSIMNCVPVYTGSAEENANIKDDLIDQGFKDETHLLKDAPPGLSMFTLKPGQSVEDLLGALQVHPFARTDKDKEFIKKNKKDWQDFINMFFAEGWPGDKSQKEWGLDPNKPNWNFYRENAEELKADIYDDQGNVMSTIPSEAIQKYFGNLKLNTDGGSDAMFDREDELKEYFGKKLGKSKYDIDSGSKLLNATLYDTEKSGKYKPLYVDLQKEYDKMPFNIQEEPDPTLVIGEGSSLDKGVAITPDMVPEDLMDIYNSTPWVIKKLLQEREEAKFDKSDLPLIPLPVAEEEVIEQPLPSPEEFYADSLPVTDSEGNVVVPGEGGSYIAPVEPGSLPSKRGRQWGGLRGFMQKVFTDKQHSGPIFRKRIKQDGGEAGNAGVTDDMSFSEAFATANKALGENGTFTWRGNTYGTRRASGDSAKDDGEIHWRDKTEEDVRKQLGYGSYKKDNYIAYLDGDIEKSKYQFLERIEEAIAETKDPIEKASLMMKRGEFDKAYDNYVDQGGTWNNEIQEWNWPVQPEKYLDQMGNEITKKEYEKLVQASKPTWMDSFWGIGRSHDMAQKLADQSGSKLIGVGGEYALDYLLPGAVAFSNPVTGVIAIGDQILESQHPGYKREIVDDVKYKYNTTANQYKSGSAQNKIMKDVKGAWNEVFGGTWARWQDGGIIVDLNEDEALAYAQDGYIVEEIK